MSVHAPGTRWYNAVWRWHFYAGLFCLPFILWLSITGTIYLWKPQIEAAIEAKYDDLNTGASRASPGAIVATVLAARPGARFDRYELPTDPHRAVRVLATADGVQSRFYVDPYRDRLMGAVVEKQRLMPWISRAHGTLLGGNPGSWLVEIAACWAITMLLTGLYLWWPRGNRGLAGVIYPRLRQGRRLFWRDTHAVAGLWVSVAAIFLIATGLPWANAWGGYLAAVRSATGTSDGPADWPTGAVRSDAHAEHRMTAAAGPGDWTAARGAALDRVVARAATLALVGPVMIAAPKAMTDGWAVAAESANRPLRTKLTIDGDSGAILTRRDFAQRQWIDRAVGYGVAIHEGAFFGLANQIAGTVVTALLVTLSVSGAVMWWRRRRRGTLGAPIPLSRPRYGIALVVAIGALGFAMPLFGATLLLVLVVERGTRGTWLARPLGLMR